MLLDLKQMVCCIVAVVCRGRHCISKALFFILIAGTMETTDQFWHREGQR